MPDNKKTVLISGAASGIGLAIAERFAATGAAVHICDVSEKKVDDFRAACPMATATVADIGGRPYRGPVQLGRLGNRSI